MMRFFRQYAAAIFLTIFAITAASAQSQSVQPLQAVQPTQQTASIESLIASDRLKTALQDISDALKGTRYRYGGNTVATGLDCSGLVRLIWKELTPVVTLSSLALSPLNLPRSAAQMAQVGTAIEIEDLQAGDLVFFNTRGFQFSHVGIYLGMGKFVHASTMLRRVTENDLSEKYFKTRFNGARRII